MSSAATLSYVGGRQYTTGLTDSSVVLASPWRQACDTGLGLITFDVPGAAALAGLRFALHGGYTDDTAERMLREGYGPGGYYSGGSPHV